MGVIGAHGDVGPLVAAEPAGQLRVMVPPGTGVELDDETIVEAHPDHLRDHLAPEAFRLLGVYFPLQGLGEEGPAGRCVQIDRHGAGVAVVRGDAAHLPEEPAALRQGLQVALPDGGVLSRDLAQAGNVFCKARKLRIDDEVGTKGGDHLSLPAGGGDLFVVFEGIQGGVRRGDRLDVEALVKSAGPELRLQKRRGEPVVDLVRIGRIETPIDAEEEMEDVLEPHPGRGSPERW